MTLIFGGHIGDDYTEAPWKLEDPEILLIY